MDCTSETGTSTLFYMFRDFVLLATVACAIAGPLTRAGVGCSENPIGGNPPGNAIDVGKEIRHRQIAPELEDVWLRFHEDELCQDMDSIFVFHEWGMEVWCVVEDKKSYRKFLKMVAPLRSSYEVYLYKTHPVEKKETADDRDPPPSLWNNQAIRDYFRDPFARSSRRSAGYTSDSGDEPAFILKQRIRMLALQTLEWEKRLRRYAADLPDLAEAGFVESFPPQLRSRAVSACISHARGLDKYAKKLLDTLTHALPRGTKQNKPENEEPKERAASLDEGAIMLSEFAHGVAQHIHQFIYPRDHTVNLADLRNPHLLGSLKELRELVSHFTDIAKQGRNRPACFAPPRSKARQERLRWARANRDRMEHNCKFRRGDDQIPNCADDGRLR